MIWQESVQIYSAARLSRYTLLFLLGLYSRTLESKLNNNHEVKVLTQCCGSVWGCSHLRGWPALELFLHTVPPASWQCSSVILNIAGFKVQKSVTFLPSQVSHLTVSCQLTSVQLIMCSAQDWPEGKKPPTQTASEDVNNGSVCWSVCVRESREWMQRMCKQILNTMLDKNSLFRGPLALFSELSVFYFSISSINCHGDGVAFIMWLGLSVTW